MESMDLQSNLALMEDIEFDEKVDIVDLVLPSKPTESAEIEINDVKQGQLEEEKQDAALEIDSDLGKEFKLKMEENILILCEELDKEKSENSATDFDFKLTRLIKIRQFVKNISEYGSLEKSHGIKPFSCKFCDKSFFQVYEVKEHIKIHNSILELEDLKSQVKTLETQVEELKVQLKSSQKNEYKRKAKVENKREIPDSGVKDIIEQRKYMNQLKDVACDEPKTENFKLKNFRKDEFKKKQSQDANQYPCKFCNKTFTTSKILSRHKKTHLGSKDNVCPICQMAFYQKHELKSHSFKHISEKSFVCQKCKTRFKTKKTLSRHHKAKTCAKEPHK